VVSLNTLTDGVPKATEGYPEGFCYFWHLITLGIPKTHDHIINIGKTTIEG
jgi:hypothetical protein